MATVLDATWKKGQLFPFLEAECLENGKALDISASKAVKVVIKKEASAAVVHTAELTTTGKDGKVRYKWPTTGANASETEVLGTYTYEFIVEFEEGAAKRPENFPSEEGDIHTFKVIPKLE